MVRLSTKAVMIFHFFLTGLFDVVHARKCQPLEISIANGNFETGDLDPWQPIGGSFDTPEISIYSPGHKDKYAAQLLLSSRNFTKDPSQDYTTSTAIIQDVYKGVCASTHYEFTVSWRWQFYDGSTDSPLCNFGVFIYPFLDLGFNSNVTAARGWQTRTLVGKSKYDSGFYEFSTGIACYPAKATNTTPIAIVLIDSISAKPLPHYYGAAPSD